jgi:DNA invertase Pin-like site-specific DNA recombinase
MTEKTLVILRESLDALAEGYGFDTQLDEVNKFLTQHDLVADRVVKLIENSTTWDREQFDLLLQDAISNRDSVPWLVFPRVDRFARKADAAFYYLGLLRRAGMRLGFARENHMVTDETTAWDVLSFGFQAAKGDEDAKTIRANTMGGRLKRAQRDGKLPNGGHRWCFDYDKATGRAVINVERANHVRNWAKWLIVDGISLSECCRQMEVKGVPAPKGGLRWRPGTITRILKDKALIGEFYAYKEKMSGANGRVKVKREHQEPLLVYKEEGETILDLPMFNAVQKRLQRNIELSRGHVTLDYTPARGFVFCANCGHRLAGVPFKRVTYFRCPICRKPSIKADMLWNAFSKQIRDILLHPKYFYQALNQYLSTGMSAEQVKGEISELETQLVNLEDNDTKLLRLYLSTNYSEDKLKVEHQRIEKQKANLADRIKWLKTELVNLEQAKLTEESFKEYSKWFQSEVDNFTDDDWRRLLARFDMKVIIDQQKQAILQMRSPINGMQTNIELKEKQSPFNDCKYGQSGSDISLYLNNCPFQPNDSTAYYLG